MRRDHKIRLTSEQEDDLQRFARSRTLPGRLVERAKMLVGYSAGHGVEEVAAQLNVARQTVRRWLDRFEAQGMQGMEARWRYPLEHAHAGPHGRRQPVHGETHLAETRFEAAPGE
jgi:predicted ArsR family transcriptional regulator